MHPVDYVKRRQICWALRRDIRLGGPFRHSRDPNEVERGERVWTFSLTDNLFEQLTDEAKQEFEEGDGGELLRGRPFDGNMFALHSSSALACNLFHYWR